MTKTGLTKLRAGDTLIEVVFALAILATLLIVITTGGINSWRVSRMAGERTQASAIAQTQVEALRAFWGGTDWATFSATPPINTAPSVTSPGTGFSMQLDTSSPRAWKVVNGSTTDGVQYTAVINRIYTPSPASNVMRFKVTVTWRSLGVNGVNTSDQVVDFGAAI